MWGDGICTVRYTKYFLDWPNSFLLDGWLLMLDSLRKLDGVIFSLSLSLSPRSPLIKRQHHWDLIPSSTGKDISCTTTSTTNGIMLHSYNLAGENMKACCPDRFQQITLDKKTEEEVYNASVLTTHDKLKKRQTCYINTSSPYCMWTCYRLERWESSNYFWSFS